MSVLSCCLLRIVAQAPLHCYTSAPSSGSLPNRCQSLGLGGVLIRAPSIYRRRLGSV